MQEIEVGEYVRTREGIIGKIYEEDDIDENGVYTDTEYINEYCDKTVYIPNKDIVKHSKNIIDLIEVGDVIKLKGEEKLKYEVLKTSYSKEKGKHIHIINPFRTEGGKDIFVEDIKSIVTREQFKSIEYKI